MNEEDDEEYDVEIDTSRKRGFQLINEFETYLQFQDIDDSIKAQLKQSFTLL